MMEALLFLKQLVTDLKDLQKEMQILKRHGAGCDPSKVLTKINRLLEKIDLMVSVLSKKAAKHDGQRTE